MVGKGVIKVLRKVYPQANIIAVDYDPGASEVNQLNRIKLMLSTAEKNIECFGSIETNKGATVSAVSDEKDADVFCSGAVVNRGAKIDGEIDAVGGVHNRD